MTRTTALTTTKTTTMTRMATTTTTTQMTQMTTTTKREDGGACAASSHLCGHQLMLQQARYNAQHDRPAYYAHYANCAKYCWYRIYLYTICTIQPTCILCTILLVSTAQYAYELHMTCIVCTILLVSYAQYTQCELHSVHNTHNISGTMCTI